MACDIGDSKGFRKITDIITKVSLNDITYKASPITLNTSPSCTSSISDNKIIPAQSCSTSCMIHSTNFTLIDIQLCKVIHGYQYDGITITPSAELILTFLPKKSSNVHGLLFCLPIYISSTENYAAYLNNIGEISSTASLDTLFYSKNTQAALEYTTCFELQDSTKTISKKLNVFTFSPGINITQQNFDKLKGKICKTNCATYEFKDYSIPDQIRENYKTVITLPSNTSNSGNIYSTVLASCNPEFKRIMKYYVSPFTSTKKSISGKSGTYNHYNMNQYKCVPFDRLNDLNTNNVASLYDITTMQDNAEIVPTATNSDDSSTDIIEIIAIVAAVPIVIFFIGFAASIIL